MHSKPDLKAEQGAYNGLERKARAPVGTAGMGTVRSARSMIPARGIAQPHRLQDGPAPGISGREEGQQDGQKQVHCDAQDEGYEGIDEL